MNRNRSKIRKILESHLGPSRSSTGAEFVFDCPVCKKEGRWRPGKKKLSVNLNSQAWHCWVCEDKGKNTKGLKFRTLLRKLTDASVSVIKKVQELAGDDDYVAYRKKRNQDRPDVELPDEYVPLWKPIADPIRQHALRYLKKRGVTKCDICKHEIGICPTGKYYNRIIIPSFDENHNLNYFVARAIFENNYKYLNPKASKNIIGFESLINWNEPITLVEGTFDAIAAKRNAIPLLGKRIPDKLYSKILTIGVRDIYLSLDKDAISEVIKHTETFLDEGINVYVILSSKHDVSDMGFKSFIKEKKNCKRVTFKDLVKLKLI